MNENDVKINKVPATGLDVSALVPEAGVLEVAVDIAAAPVTPASVGKITQGRKVRDDKGRRSPRAGTPGAPGASQGGGRGGRGGGRGDSRERVKPEFDSKIIDIRRVTRVTSGGRRMNFSVAVVAGDHKGRVGVGMGKSIDTAGAVDKATRDAKKNLIKVTLSPQMTIPHAVEAKYGSARIMLFPARGRGVVAGSSARTVIELAGIQDICAKLLSGSKNRLNNARAAVAALKKLSKVSRASLNPSKEARPAGRSDGAKI